MAQQLIYTSAPKLLDAGRSGFGTVARSRSLGALASGAIERVSQFANLRGYDRGRIIHAYRRITAGSQKLYVLTRIRDCGSDYTGRTNHIAHHLVVSPEEVARAEARGLTPADVMRQFPWRDSWDGPPRSLEPSDDADLGAFRPLGKASGRAAFAKITGEPLHARLLAWDEAPRSGVVIVPEHADPLELLTEACAEFARQPWSRTFTTSLETTDELGEFDWVLIKSTTADLVLPRIGSRPRFDLTNPTSLPLPTEEVRSIPVPTAATENPRSHVRQTTRPPDGFSQNSPLPTCSTHGQAIENEAQKVGNPAVGAKTPRSHRQKERRNHKNLLWLGAAGVSVLIGLILALIFHGPADGDRRVESKGPGAQASWAGQVELTQDEKESNSKVAAAQAITPSQEKPTQEEKSKYQTKLVELKVNEKLAKDWAGRKTKSQLDRCVNAMGAIQNLDGVAKAFNFKGQPGEVKQLLGKINEVMGGVNSEELNEVVRSLSDWGAHFSPELLDNTIKWALSKNEDDLSNEDFRRKLESMLDESKFKKSVKYLKAFKSTPVVEAPNPARTNESPVASAIKEPTPKSKELTQPFYIRRGTPFKGDSSKAYKDITKSTQDGYLDSEDFSVRYKISDKWGEPLDYRQLRDKGPKVGSSGLTFPGDVDEVEISYKRESITLSILIGDIFAGIKNKAEGSIAGDKIILSGDPVEELIKRLRFSSGYPGVQAKVIFDDRPTKIKLDNSNNKLEGEFGKPKVVRQVPEDLIKAIEQGLTQHDELASGLNEESDDKNKKPTRDKMRRIMRDLNDRIKNQGFAERFGLKSHESLNQDLLRRALQEIKSKKDPGEPIPTKTELILGDENFELDVTWSKE